MSGKRIFRGHGTVHFFGTEKKAATHITRLVHVCHAGSCLFKIRVPRNVIASNGLQRRRVLCGDDNGVDFPRLDGSIDPLHAFNQLTSYRLGVITKGHCVARILPVPYRNLHVS